jgi:dGTP triphosphohydrolase
VKTQDARTPSESDYDKILYSPYVRRLSGVTQVFTPDPVLPRQHSRLSHSQKVSAVAAKSLPISIGLVKLNKIPRTHDKLMSGPPQQPDWLTT